MAFHDCSFVDDDTTIVCCVSGGKDSTAMILHLRELDLPNPIRFVHSDTGWEFPITVAYLDYLRGRIGVDIEASTGQFTFESLMIHKGVFASMRRRFCTELLKVVPMKHYLNGKRWISANDEDPTDGEWMQLEPELENAVYAVGVRAQESAKRAGMSEWDEDGKAYDRPVWRPLLEWSAEEVFDAHKANGVDWNPLYELGFNRVGCAPCVNVSKAQWRRVIKAFPWVVDKLRDLEARVNEKSNDGCASFFHSTKVPPKYHDRVAVSKTRTIKREFDSPMFGAGEVEEVVGGETFTYASVDAAVEWVMSGEEDPALFDNEPIGCFSQYGICE